MSNFKPMLSGKLTNLKALSYPVIISPKLDGIRAVNLGDGKLVSRSLKPIPNAYVQQLFGGTELRYFDGELICGSPTSESVYRDTNSAVMSQDGEPDVKYYVFDHFQYFGEVFGDRMRRIPKPLPKGCVLVEQRLVFSEESLLEWEQKWLEMGYEGVMVRSGIGGYKFGRSTEKEGVLMKLKRMETSEAVIYDFVELMSNQNEATKDALGHTDRSSHKENMVPMGTLGALKVRDVEDGVEFSIGTGFDAKTRAEIWANRGEWMGKIVSYNHFPIGRKDLPRFPSYKGLRDKIDMEAPK